MIKISCSCTYYPLLEPLLARLLGLSVTLADSAETCARYVQKSLVGDDWFSSGELDASDHIYLTDQPTHFTSMAERFLEREMDSVEVVQVGSL